MNQKLQAELNAMNGELSLLFTQIKGTWVAEQMQLKLSKSLDVFAADMRKYLRIRDYEDEAIEHFQSDLTEDLDWNEFNTILEATNDRLYSRTRDTTISCKTRTFGLASILLISGYTALQFVGYGPYINPTNRFSKLGHVWIRVNIAGKWIELDAMAIDGKPSPQATERSKSNIGFSIPVEF